MKYSCLHTHCSYCDGKGSIEDFCEAAIKANFASIGFSSHAPLAALDTAWHMKKELFANYIDDVRAAGEKYSPRLDIASERKLKVFLGLEADFLRPYNSKDGTPQEILTSPIEWSNHPFVDFDYIIGSTHYITREVCADSSDAEFSKMLDDTFNGDIWAVIDAYYSNVALMIKTGGFDILGHIDLIKRNNAGNKYFNETDSKYKKYISDIANLLADTKIVVEINTGGMARGYTTEPYPSKDFLLLLKKNNVKVMINSDAHKIEQLGAYYETARSLLLEVGYTKIVFLQGRYKNNAAIWSEDDL